jgi:hypothetical protein
MTEAYIVWAVSYTGATWISLVLGSRPEVLAVGNPDRALQRLRENPKEACRIHGAECRLWPAFAASWDGRGDPFGPLAVFAGKAALVLRNPKPELLSTLASVGMTQRHIVLTRDLRALVASYMRKNPTKDVVQALDDWGYSAAQHTHRFLQRPGVTVIQHHRASGDLDYLHGKLREATGRDYGADQDRFWEHDHHIVAGNGATMRVVVAYQRKQEHRQPFYADFVDRVERKGDTKFVDERWRSELDRFALFVIDRCLGAYQTEFGFERDQFTAAEDAEFTCRLVNAIKGRSLKNAFPGQRMTVRALLWRAARWARTRAP